MKLFILLIWLFSVASVTSFAQGNIRGLQSRASPVQVTGIIKDKKTKEVFPFASVMIYINGNFKEGCVSDTGGIFSMFLDRQNLSDTVFELRVSAIGYYAETMKQIPLTDLLNAKQFNFEIAKDTMFENGHNPMPITNYAIPPIPKSPK